MTPSNQSLEKAREIVNKHIGYTSDETGEYYLYFKEPGSTLEDDIALELGQARQEGRREQMEIDFEIASDHVSLRKRNELIAKYPAGDSAMGMAAFVSKAIRQNFEEGR